MKEKKEPKTDDHAAQIPLQPPAPSEIPAIDHEGEPRAEEEERSDSRE